MYFVFNEVHYSVEYVYRFATARWMSQHYKNQFQDNQYFSCGGFMNTLQRDLVLDCSKEKAYRAKRFASEYLMGTYKEQYAKLWDYAAEIKRSNPGSTVMIHSSFEDGKPVFKRIYICYKGCMEGFNEGCRPLIGLDGCHLKGHHSGQLLTGIGIDANNGIFPIAFAVVILSGKSRLCMDECTLWISEMGLVLADNGIYQVIFMSFNLFHVM